MSNEISKLKPIETKYKGYRFRSRLEARWAVFFENMGLDWSYEVEGFQLPNGLWYLPDFFVKGHKTGFDYYYEIKPKGSDFCPKVLEFSSVLLANEIYKNDIDTTYFRGQIIKQLNGDPFDVVESVCPRCKQINGLDYKIELEDFSASCIACDITKEKGGEWLEKDGCEIDGVKYDLEWHKGEILISHGYFSNENNGSKIRHDCDWAEPFLNKIDDAKLLSRQVRFDGSDFQ